MKYVDNRSPEEIKAQREQIIKILDIVAPIFVALPFILIILLYVHRVPFIDGLLPDFPPEGVGVAIPKVLFHTIIISTILFFTEGMLWICARHENIRIPLFSTVAKKLKSFFVSLCNADERCQPLESSPKNTNTEKNTTTSIVEKFAWWGVSIFPIIFLGYISFVMFTPYIYPSLSTQTWPILSPTIFVCVYSVGSLIFLFIRMGKTTPPQVIMQIIRIMDKVTRIIAWVFLLVLGLLIAINILGTLS